MNVHTDLNDDAAIRSLIRRCADGLRAMDIDAIVDCHTDDVVCFDCHSQFESRGAAAMRAFLEACLPHMQGPIEHEIHDLSVAASGDLGVAYYHVRSSCRDHEGGEHGGWLRITIALRRTGDGWRSCHAHISAPFNPMTEKTMFGLPREANPFIEGVA